MIKANELRKTLEDGLRTDTSGKTTPIQRLTPFLKDLVLYLEQNEINHFQDHEVIHGHLNEHGTFVVDKVSSDDATQVATAQTNSESDGATKPEAHQPKAQHRDVQQALGTALEPLPANRSAGE